MKKENFSPALLLEATSAPATMPRALLGRPCSFWMKRNEILGFTLRWEH